MQQKSLSGKQLQFQASIKNFKADGEDVTITLTADSKKMNLNDLNTIASNRVTVELTSVQTELIPIESKEVK